MSCTFIHVATRQDNKTSPKNSLQLEVSRLVSIISVMFSARLVVTSTSQDSSYLETIVSRLRVE